MSELSPEQIRAKRMRWHCRRGTTELERMLGRHLDQLLARGDAGALDVFEQLLAEEDRDLQRWLLGYEACTIPEYASLINDLRQPV